MILQTDANGRPLTGVINAASYVDNLVLAANTNYEYTVPVGCTVLIIAATGDMWVNFNGAAAAEPVANVLNGSGSVFNPVGRIVTAGQKVNFKSTLGCKVSLEVL